VNPNTKFVNDLIITRKEAKQYFRYAKILDNVETGRRYNVTKAVSARNNLNALCIRLTGRVYKYVQDRMISPGLDLDLNHREYVGRAIANRSVTAAYKGTAKFTLEEIQSYQCTHVSIEDVKAKKRFWISPWPNKELDALAALIQQKITYKLNNLRQDEQVVTG
jgi:hypothetical protein